MLKSLPLALATMALCVASTVTAEAIRRVAVSDVKPLLLAALQSTDGEAHGELVGEIADALSRRFDGQGPITIDVTTLRHFAQPGCSRLNVRFRQEAVKLPGDTAPHRQTVDIGINYCLDGLPPRSEQ